MSLLLEAIFELEGTAIVRDGKALLLVRPPYRLPDCPVLSEGSIPDAVLKHGFSAAGENFPDWQTLVQYLNDKAVKARQSLGTDIPTSINGVEVMEAAPLPVLKKFLDRVEQELIPKHLFEQAENILLKLLSSNVRHRLPQLSDQAIFLLQKCKDARFQSHAGITELAEGDTRFSTLPNHGQVEECKRVSARIKKQGCVFNLGV